MTFSLKKIIPLVLLVCAFLWSTPVSAQEDQLSVDGFYNALDFAVTKLEKTASGIYYYRIATKDGARVERTEKEADVYLMLRESLDGNDGPHELAHYAGGSATFSISYPPTPLNEATLPRLKAGGHYEIYFSSDPNGFESISEVIGVDSIPEASSNTTPSGSGSASAQNTQATASNTASANTTTASTSTRTSPSSNGSGSLVSTVCGYDLNTFANPDGTGRLCGFADLISLIQRIIEYIFVLILPIAALVFAYAGYLYLTSGGSAEKRTAAKNAIKNVLIGIVIVMIAWLAVKTLLVSLGVDESFLIYLDI